MRPSNSFYSPPFEEAIKDREQGLSTCKSRDGIQTQGQASDNADVGHRDRVAPVVTVVRDRSELS
jgi:hypothetical protein